MKREQFSRRAGGWKLSQFVTVTAAMAMVLSGSSRAEQVDTELLFLVDTSVFVSAQNLTDTLDSFAQSFESVDMVSALQGGPEGRIAAAMVLFSGPGTQVVTVPWMSISDLSSSQAFADAIRASQRPAPPSFTSSFANALDFGTLQFGSETGAPGNGFESASQVINMSSETLLIPAESAATVQAASSQALADGVDVINALATGTFNQAAALNYYSTNIVGGSVGGVPGTVTSAPDYTALPTATLLSLETQISAAVPEPSAVLLLSFGSLLLARRRKT